MTNSEKLIFQWAEKYISLGWFLLPIIPEQKNPYIKWKHRRDQKPDIKEVQDWLQKWPQMNLGIATGQLSGVVVVDLDEQEGLAYGKSHKFVSSVTALSGRIGIGKHLYYRWETEIRGSVSKIAPHVDLRGDGDIIILPPSQHKSGKRYRWERFIPNGLINLPNGLILPSADVTIVGKDPGWVAKALKEMKIGNIDTTLTSVCGRLRRDGYSQEDCFRLLEPHAITAGAEKGHLEEKIRNIWSRYAAANEPKQFGLQQGLWTSSTSGSELSIHSPADDDSFNKFQCSLVSDNNKRGLQTGFPTLDKYFEGGFKSERPFVIAARTGTGKTNFGIALSNNLTLQGKKVLYFSTEFNYRKIWSWFIPYCKEGIDEFRKRSFYVCDSFNPNIDSIEKALIEYKPDIFIFDYIQHLSKEKEILTQFVKDCQFLQQKYNIQSVIMAQLGRSADWVDDNGKRIEPRMDMISGSASIEEGASRVLLLSKTKEDIEKNEIIGVLAKNDQGDTGLIHFALMKHPFIFKELI